MNGVPLWQLAAFEGTPVNWCSTSATTMTALSSVLAKFRSGKPCIKLCPMQGLCRSMHSATNLEQSGSMLTGCEDSQYHLDLSHSTEHSQKAMVTGVKDSHCGPKTSLSCKM